MSNWWARMLGLDERPSKQDDAQDAELADAKIRVEALNIRVGTIGSRLDQHEKKDAKDAHH